MFDIEKHYISFQVASNMSASYHLVIALAVHRTLNIVEIPHHWTTVSLW